MSHLPCLPQAALEKEWVSPLNRHATTICGEAFLQFNLRKSCFEHFWNLIDELWFSHQVLLPQRLIPTVKHG